MSAKAAQYADRFKKVFEQAAEAAVTDKRTIQEQIAALQDKRSEIDKQIAGLQKMIRPKVLYTTKKIQKIEGSTLTLEGDIKLKSAKISKTLGKCDRITFFLATIGDRVDDVINTVKEVL